MTSDELAEFHKQAQVAIGDFVQRENFACEELTKSQLAEVIRQMLACGDIQRNVVHPPKLGEITQSVIYIPFAREQELNSRIQKLESLLTRHGIEFTEDIEYQ